MATIEEARKIIADLAKQEGEHQFSREVLAGCWDDRSDVQSILAGTFKPRQIKSIDWENLHTRVVESLFHSE